MRSIRVDTDVFAAIWSRRKAGENAENDILRRLLLSDSTDLRCDTPPGEASVSSRDNPTSQRDLEAKTSLTERADMQIAEGKVRWVDDVVAALRQLGGGQRCTEFTPRLSDGDVMEEGVSPEHLKPPYGGRLKTTLRTQQTLEVMTILSYSAGVNGD